jgi:hypothetical protein
LPTFTNPERVAPIPVIAQFCLGSPFTEKVTSRPVMIYIAAVTKHTRKRTPGPIELRILDKSRRRCALCFQLIGDLSEKRGQIAHLDGDPANVAEDNLAWFCLEHHSLYDSKTSQHKNYTMAEVKSARSRLYKAMENDEHLTGGRSAAGGIETDRAQLAYLVATMTGYPYTYSNMLRYHDFSGSFRRSDLDPVSELAGRGVEDEFIDTELEELHITLVKAAREFLSFIGKYTEPLGNSDDRYVVLGHGEREYPWAPLKLERAAAITDLNESATATAEAYDALVRRARRKLAP